VWVGHHSTWNVVRQFATANNYHAYWTDFGGGRPSQLLGYSVYNSSAMDSTRVSGSNDDIIVLGDFSNYVIVDRVGMSVLYEPIVKGSNQRPTGQGGWFAFWRVGGDSVNDDAFRMLRI
jgi:HK97 family phage major capsid protein